MLFASVLMFAAAGSANVAPPELRECMRPLMQAVCTGHYVDVRIEVNADGGGKLIGMRVLEPHTHPLDLEFAHCVFRRPAALPAGSLKPGKKEIMFSARNDGCPGDLLVRLDGGR